jgi:hypothetical protein
VLAVKTTIWVRLGDVVVSQYDLGEMGQGGRTLRNNQLKSVTGCGSNGTVITNYRRIAFVGGILKT